jgi:uncharacterized NAD(P)/FAD-binding protein YdhS
MRSENSIPVFAIIGGGISGCLVAAQLLRTAQAPLKIVLFERMTDVGRGVAYGTENREHLLNVPANRMSALPDQPDHFYEWVAERVGRENYPARFAPEDFVPRWIFGEYVRALLVESQSAAAVEVELERIKGEVVDFEEEGELVRIRCGDSRSFLADRVVLAIGNLPGEYPIKKPLPVYHSQRYVHVPWRPGTLAGIPADEDVLIVGAGLTAIDIVLELQARGHTGNIFALSRRGLRPQVHKVAEAYPDFLAGEDLPSTMLELSRRVRREIRAGAKAGVDWRPVIDALRLHSADLWRNLSWSERARFMRHVRPFWEIHRHRVAPAVAEKIQEQCESGRLQFHAGRLLKLTEKPDGVEAQFRLRRSGLVQTVKVAKVINCTGPRSDYSKYQHPLLINLLARGLIDHDPLALGITATTDGGVQRYRGDPVGWLFTIGAPLKGVLWETTSVPEIREQAKSLAKQLLMSVDLTTASIA